MRTLIYARYSSQLQNPRSIEDQIAACRKRAADEGWEVVEAFHDRAISGAAGIEGAQRPGLAALLAALDVGGIDQVLTESTDRLARHQGDAFAVRERIEYAGARLFTLMDGVVDDITGTIKGLLDARTRKDLAVRVRRGHKGNIAMGRATGGVPYGYRKIARLDEDGEPVRGLREPDPDTAPVVQRIFRDYANGQSARAIAAALNSEGIPSPRGGIWRASTIAGHRKEATGMLTNPVYIGQLHYGRTKMVSDPRTRRRRTRKGDGDVTIGQAPHLRLIEDDLWQAVQDQLELRASTRPERQRRPKHLLSGLGQCGICGGTWVATRATYFGCGQHTGGKACTNTRLILTEEYEARVLAELKEQMLAPDVVEAYLEEYRAEHARRAGELGRNRARLERRIADAGRKVERLVAAIADGGAEFAAVKSALTAAQKDLAEAEKERASIEALPKLALHPGLARQYRAAIEQLAIELKDEATRLEAAPKLRSLIARIIVTPSKGKRGVDLEVVRHIDEVLDLAQPDRRRA
ncbi:MAG: recombinase family protein [Pelagibaca sp.]|nr:recombinase family protein [Pelagibaca sp.]